MNTRRQKLEFLKGVETGARTLEELLPVIKYNVFSEDAGHEIMNLATNKKQILNDEDFKQWEQKNKPFISLHFIEKEQDPRDNPIDEN